MLTAHSDISSQQFCAMANMASALTKFLNYCASHPNATIMYEASDMILKTHSDRLYLNLPGAWSQVGGHHYLGNDTTKKLEIYNGLLLNTPGIVKIVVSSTVEDKFGGFFVSTKEATIL